MISCASPEAIFSRAARFCAGVFEPVSSRTWTPSGPSSADSVFLCCSARSSVGAMNAACFPFLTAQKQAAAAIIVLPLPTSPCTSRFITCPEDRSCRICSITPFCAPVSRKGSARKNASMQPVSYGAACSSVLDARRTARPAEKIKNSSKTSRFRARCSASQLSGAWTAVYASVTPQRLYCVRTASGRSSGRAPAAESACWIQAQSVRLESPAVSGYTGSRRFVTVPGLSASSKAGFAICMPCSSSAP